VILNKIGGYCVKFSAAELTVIMEATLVLCVYMCVGGKLRNAIG